MGEMQYGLFANLDIYHVASQQLLSIRFVQVYYHGRSNILIFT
jgi:hypothetical protein